VANLFGCILNYIFLLLGIIIAIAFLIRKCFLREKTEKAVVVDKQSYDRQIFSKNQALSVETEYIVSFQNRNKIYHFKVSEFSYNNYKINQKGTLKYKGKHLIDFN